MGSNHLYYTIMHGNCQSSNLIYCLECNICCIKYVDQTKNRILDKFNGNLPDIRNLRSVPVSRNFASQGETYRPLLTVHILEYIKVSEDIQRSKSLRDKRELTWIHMHNTLIPNGLNIIDWFVACQKRKKGLIKLHIACLINIVKHNDPIT